MKHSTDLVRPVDVDGDAVGGPGTLVDHVEGVENTTADLPDVPHRRLSHHLHHNAALVHSE